MMSTQDSGNTIQEHRKTRVVIAEDEQLLAEMLPDLLQATSQGRIEVVKTCLSRSQLSRTLGTTKPDILLCDIWMPCDGEGLPAPYNAPSLKALKRRSPDTAVLLLSGSSDAVLVKSLLDSGADGFISKGVPPQQVCQTIERIRRGGKYIDPRFKQQIDRLHIDSNEPIRTRLLTGRRGDVLRLLLEGFSIRQIAEVLPIGRKHVTKKVSEIKSMLGVETHIGIFRACLGLGIIKV